MKILNSKHIIKAVLHPLKTTIPPEYRSIDLYSYLGGRGTLASLGELSIHSRKSIKEVVIRIADLRCLPMLVSLYHGTTELLGSFN